MQSIVFMNPYTLEYYYNQNMIPFPDKKEFLIMLSGLCGYACQMAVREEKKSFVLVTAGGKNYFFGDALNYYLINSENSFINLMKETFENLFRNIDFPDWKKILKNVASNIGNKNYKINNLFNPEDKFPDYLKNWNDIFDLIKRNTNKPEEWPFILTYVLDIFMTTYFKHFGGKELIELFPIVIENAFYTSKIIAE